MTQLQQTFLDFCKNEQSPFIPTPQQQKAIFEKVNIVPAGAGSGKTAVLAHRFLWLIMSDKDIHSDEILTMTFTKDATASMKKKIYGILVQAVESGLIKAEELDNFSSSTIATTDSFCSEIAKSACSRYGLSANFEIESDDDLLSVADEITDSIFENHADDPCLRKLLSVWSVDNFREFFKELADKHISISSNRDFKEYRNLVQKTFDFDCEQLEADMCQNIEQIIQLYDESKQSPTLLNNLKIYNGYLENKSYSDLIGLQKINETVGGNGCKEIVKKVKAQSENLAKIHEESLTNLDTIAVLCNEFEAAVIKHKRETGHVTYHDVLLLAIDILQNDKNIRDYYQNKFKAIMVDEFQDNNEDNKTLVYLIAGNNREKVFMVGDEKQSIYRFRNADVSVFKKMSEDFEPENIAVLPDNFRSEKALIDTINRIFAKIMENAANDFEASYSELVSSNERVKPKIRILLGKKDEGITPESEAFNVAKTIRQILGEQRKDYQVSDNGILRDPKESDIAVLLKVGTNQIEYEKAFRAYGIPFESDESKSLTMDAVLNDFYNLLQLAVWGSYDGVSWLSFLKSPFCNCSDDFIEAGNFEEQYGIVEKVRSELSNYTLAETVSYIWYNLGYRFFILRDKKNHQYEEHYEYLFTLANQFDQAGKSVVEFLDYIRPMLGSESKIKDLRIQREKSLGVVIQSIHKSKGLDYPIVIIPDMQSGTRGHGGFKPNVENVDGVVTYPYVMSESLTNPMINKDLDSEKDFAETKRVLYVAATRAKNHLIFSGIEPGKLTDAFNKTMLGCLLQAAGEDVGKEYFDGSAVIEDNSSAHTNVDDSMYSTVREFSFTKLTDAITSLDDKDTSFDNPLPLYDCDKVLESSTDFGTYVHWLLENAVNRIDVSNEYGVFENSPDREIIRRDALKMRDNFINSEFYKSLEGFEKHTERGFFRYDAERNSVLEGIVDLLCISKDKVVIVDYKTDKFKDPSTHKNQLEIYSKAMAEKYHRDVEAYLFYVRSGENLLCCTEVKTAD